MSDVSDFDFWPGEWAIHNCRLRERQLAGVVLVSEGPTHRVKPLLDAERKKLARILPNVTIHVIESGKGEGQTPISQVAKKMNKLNKELTKIEVSAVSKRISSLGNRLPIPKGIDPYKARPQRGR